MVVMVMLAVVEVFDREEPLDTGDAVLGERDGARLFFPGESAIHC